MGIIADQVKARGEDDRKALVFEDHTWTYREWVQECADRAAWFQSHRSDGPPHIGVLLANTPDFTMWLGAAAMLGATIVGINPTRRGAELARDITHTDVQVVVTDAEHLPLLEGLHLGAADGCVLVTDHPSYEVALAPHRGASLPDVVVTPEHQFLLLFTSGTSGAPKAVICTQGRLGIVCDGIIGINSLTSDDVTYSSMPLFHSNALFTAWGPTVAAGATLVLRRTFSASAFLDDVRRHGCTYFNYVGKPLAYVLATPERAGDDDNPLRRGYGNEANETDLRRFAERFDCTLNDGYGQTETGATVVRVPGMPAGALGVGAPTVLVLDPATGDECPQAAFDTDGRLLNAAEATGEIVNTEPVMFEGYYNNPEATAERMRNGWYWTGDLAYRDEAGFFYFAGRTADWLRVDGENFSAGPVERILARFDDVVLAVVYGIPDPEAGDQMMAAVQLAPGATFDAEAFATFCAEQPDLSPKWLPRFVRVVTDFPMTQTNKVLKRQMVLQRWDVADEMWWRPGREATFRRFTADDATDLIAQFDAHGRSGVLV